MASSAALAEDAEAVAISVKAHDVRNDDGVVEQVEAAVASGPDSVVGATEMAVDTLGVHLEEWTRERAARGEDPNDWAEFRAHLERIGAPDPGQVPVPHAFGSMAPLLSDNPNLVDQLDDWARERLSRGQSPNDWASFRAHVEEIGAPDPGGQPPSTALAPTAPAAGLGAANPNLLEQLATWIRLRSERGQDEFDWEEFRRHERRIDAPDPGPATQLPHLLAGSPWSAGQPPALLPWADAEVQRRVWELAQQMPVVHRLETDARTFCQSPEGFHPAACGRFSVEPPAVCLDVGTWTDAECLPLIHPQPIACLADWWNLSDCSAYMLEPPQPLPAALVESLLSSLAPGGLFRGPQDCGEHCADVYTVWVVRQLGPRYGGAYADADAAVTALGRAGLPVIVPDAVGTVLAHPATGAFGVSVTTRLTTDPRRDEATLAGGAAAVGGTVGYYAIAKPICARAAAACFATTLLVEYTAGSVAYTLATSNREPFSPDEDHPYPGLTKVLAEQGADFALVTVGYEVCMAGAAVAIGTGVGAVAGVALGAGCMGAATIAAPIAREFVEELAGPTMEPFADQYLEDPDDLARTTARLAEESRRKAKSAEQLLHERRQQFPDLPPAVPVPTGSVDEDLLVGESIYQRSLENDVDAEPAEAVRQDERSRRAAERADAERRAAVDRAEQLERRADQARQTLARTPEAPYVEPLMAPASNFDQEIARQHEQHRQLLPGEIAGLVEKAGAERERAKTPEQRALEAAARQRTDVAAARNAAWEQQQHRSGASTSGFGAYASAHDQLTP